MKLMSSSSSAVPSGSSNKGYTLFETPKVESPSSMNVTATRKLKRTSMPNLLSAASKTASSKYLGISSQVLTNSNSTFKKASHVEVRRKEATARKLAHSTFLKTQERVLDDFESFSVQLRKDMQATLNAGGSDHSRSRIKKGSGHSRNSGDDDDDKEPKSSTSRRGSKSKRKSRSRRNLLSSGSSKSNLGGDKKKLGKSSGLPPKSKSHSTSKPTPSTPQGRPRSLRRSATHGGILTLGARNDVTKETMRRTQSLEEREAQKKAKQIAATKLILQKLESSASNHHSPLKRVESASSALRKQESSKLKRVESASSSRAFKNNLDSSLKRAESAGSLKRVDSAARLRRQRWHSTHSQRNMEAQKKEEEEDDVSTVQAANPATAAVNKYPMARRNSCAGLGGVTIASAEPEQKAHRPRRRQSMGASFAHSNFSNTAVGATPRTRRRGRRSSQVGNAQIRRALDQNRKHSSLRDISTFGSEQQQAAEVHHPHHTSLTFHFSPAQEDDQADLDASFGSFGSIGSDSMNGSARELDLDSLASLERRSTAGSRRNLGSDHHSRSSSYRSLLDSGSSRNLNSSFRATGVGPEDSSDYEDDSGDLHRSASDRLNLRSAGQLHGSFHSSSQRLGLGRVGPHRHHGSSRPNMFEAIIESALDESYNSVSSSGSSVITGPMVMATPKKKDLRTLPKDFSRRSPKPSYLYAPTSGAFNDLGDESKEEEEDHNDNDSDEFAL